MEGHGMVKYQRVCDSVGKVSLESCWETPVVSSITIKYLLFWTFEFIH